MSKPPPLPPLTTAIGYLVIAVAGLTIRSLCFGVGG
jgi:hypothetical protein